MTEEEAIKTAEEWLRVRNEVRLALIIAARVANPVDAQVADSHARWKWPSNEVRKLYQYPSDLSEQRLVDLILDGRRRMG